MVCSPSQAFDLLKDDSCPDAESLIVLGFDGKNRIRYQEVFKHLIAKGKHNSLIASPIDIFSPLLRVSCKNFILAHNHPSGDVNPSEEDLRFCRKISQAAKLLGISFLDNLIFSDQEYYSFRQHGLI
jgi:DNA repair protein RadC